MTCADWSFAGRIPSVLALAGASGGWPTRFVRKLCQPLKLWESRCRLDFAPRRCHEKKRCFLLRCLQNRCSGASGAGKLCLTSSPVAVQTQEVFFEHDWSKLCLQFVSHMPFFGCVLFGHALWIPMNFQVMFLL